MATKFKIYPPNTKVKLTMDHNGVSAGAKGEIVRFVRKGVLEGTNKNKDWNLYKVRFHGYGIIYNFFGFRLEVLENSGHNHRLTKIFV